MPTLRNDYHTPEPFSMAGTYGTLTLAPRDQAVVIQTVGRSYDTTGHLRVEAAQIRIPVAEAYRLHEALGRSIIQAESTEDTRQTALWSDSSTVRAMVSRVGRRAA